MAQQQNDNVMRRYVRQCLHRRSGSKTSDYSLLFFFFFFTGVLLLSCALKIVTSTVSPLVARKLKLELAFNPASVHYDADLKITIGSW